MCHPWHSESDGWIEEGGVYQPRRHICNVSIGGGRGIIERLWGFAKRHSVYGKYHANFDSFRAAIENTLAKIPTTHAQRLESLMTLKFQEFKDVSLLAG
jgi:hypothetical protein